MIDENHSAATEKPDEVALKGDNDEALDVTANSPTDVRKGCQKNKARLGNPSTAKAEEGIRRQPKSD